MLVDAARLVTAAYIDKASWLLHSAASLADPDDPEYGLCEECRPLFETDAPDEGKPEPEHHCDDDWHVCADCGLRFRGPRPSDPEPISVEDKEWPEAVSDGLTIPCMRCGGIPAVDYFVDDDFWREVAAPHERKNVVCLECLCRDHAGVAKHLRRLQVVDKNDKVTSVLVPATRIHWGPNPHCNTEGGRPYGTDPLGSDASPGNEPSVDGPSNGTGDASVDTDTESV